MSFDIEKALENGYEKHSVMLQLDVDGVNITTDWMWFLASEGTKIDALIERAHDLLKWREWQWPENLNPVNVEEMDA